MMFAGCSDGRPKRVQVAGQVLIDGLPLKYGFISFVPANARPSNCKLDSDGRFRLSCFEHADGAVLGTHRVAVNAGEPIGGDKVRWHAPKKYLLTETSQLEQEITDATQDLVIKLTWDGRKPFIEKQDADAEGAQ